MLLKKNPKPFNFLCLRLFLLSIAAHGLAQEEPGFSPDRPGQSDGTFTVPPGFFQLEMGWDTAFNESGGVEDRQYQWPFTLLRMGLVEDLELRLAWCGRIRGETRIGGNTLTDEGSGDAAVGARYRIRKGISGGPAVALLASMSVPVGDEGYSSERYDPALKLACDQSLTERLSLTVNLGIAWSTVPETPRDRDTLSTAGYSASLGIGLSPGVSAFIEVFGETPASAPGGSSHGIDGGFALVRKNRFHLDISGGTGLSDDGPDWFAGFGFAFGWAR